MVHDAVARHRSGILSLDSFKRCMKNGQELEPRLSANAAQGGCMPFDMLASLPTLKEAETFLVREALKRSEGNQGIAASLLGITRTALNKRLKRDAGLLS